MVMRPKPTGSATLKKKMQEMLKKKKKDALKNKVKEKLKQKKKTKSTKTGLLSKACLMPVSTPGGIPKVMSQKTAQKDLKPKRPKQRQPQDMPGIRPPKDRPGPFFSPKKPPRRFMPMSMNNGGTPAMNKKIMDLARKLKPTGRLNADDMKRAKALLTGPQNRLKLLRKGLKPVLDSKGKPVKNLTQKAGPGKPMSPETRKQLRRLFDDVGMRMPKRQKKGMKSLMGTAGSGMRKGFGGKNLKTAAKKMRKIM